MKYAAAIAVIVIAVLFNYWAIPGLELPFARVKPSPDACTLKVVWPTGSPFRTNLYDDCEQDDSIHFGALLVNILFWTIVMLMAYKYAEKKTSVKKRIKNKQT